MSNDSRVTADGGFDMTAFEEWVEQTAQEKGMGKQEVIEKMMSSYWILDELTGMMDDPPPETNHDRSETPISDSQLENESTRDLSGSTKQSNIQELIQNIDDLKQELNADDPEPQGHKPQPQNDARREQRPQEEGRYPRSEGDYRDSEHSPAGKVDQLEKQLYWLASEFDDIDSRLETETAEMTEQLEDLAQQVDQISANLEGKADSTAVNELSERLNEVITELQKRQEELDTQMEHEFEDLNDILQYLVTRDEQHEDHLATLVNQYQADMERLIEFKREQSRLAELKQTAARLDIQTAACDECDTSLTVQALAKPRCPSCDRRFGSISEKQGWLRGKNKLVTVADEPDPELTDFSGMAELLDDASHEESHEMQQINATDDSVDQSEFEFGLLDDDN